MTWAPHVPTAIKSLHLIYCTKINKSFCLLLNRVTGPSYIFSDFRSCEVKTDRLRASSYTSRYIPCVAFWPYVCINQRLLTSCFKMETTRILGQMTSFEDVEPDFVEMRLLLTQNDAENQSYPGTYNHKGNLMWVDLICCMVFFIWKCLWLIRITAWTRKLLNLITCKHSHDKNWCTISPVDFQGQRKC